MPILKSSQIEEAARLILAGEPVAFPTETVYGLGASVFDEKAISKIFALKGRPSDNPLIVHVANLKQIDEIAEMTPEAARLFERFAPGPLSIVMQKRGCVPSIVTAGHPTVAVRWPSHPIALALIERVGAPLVAPSANLSGKPSSTRASHVIDDFGGTGVAVIDGGECKVGIESTVISVVGQPTLLRPGAISREELEEVLGCTLSATNESERPQAPGMKYRHYAPEAEVVLVEAPQPGYTLTPAFESLYADFREADRLGIKTIFVVCDEKVRSNAALMNRILKASKKV